LPRTYRGVAAEKLARHHIEEYLKLYRMLMEKSDIDKYDAIALIAMATGRRVSEILGLEPGDVDFANRRITFKILKKRGTYRLAIEISEKVWGKIEPFLRNLPFNLSRITVYKVFMKRYGYNPHAFRHFFALYCLETYRDIERCRRFLAHSNYNLLARYADAVGIDLKTPLD